MNSTKYSEITSLKAYVGGYFGHSYSIKIDFIGQKISWECSERGVILEQCQRKVREKTIRGLIERLKETNLLLWKEHYYEPIMDGTSWAVKIASNDKINEKSGSNGFPDEWDYFCKILSNLVRKPFR